MAGLGKITIHITANISPSDVSTCNESYYKSDKEMQKLIKQLGYKGCQNCQYQIEPLRMCDWAEHGGDGIVHPICPRWDKKESEE